MANLYKRGRVWWGRAAVHGVEHRASLNTHHEAGAKERFRNWLVEIGSRSYAHSVRGHLGGMLANPKRPSGTIYAIGYGDKVKIGWTSGLARYRLDSLQTGCPENLDLLVSRPGSRADERALHRKFAAHHIRGEWFRIEGPVGEWIDGINRERSDEAGSADDAARSTKDRLITAPPSPPRHRAGARPAGPSGIGAYRSGHGRECGFALATAHQTEAPQRGGESGQDYDDPVGSGGPTIVRESGKWLVNF